MRDSNINQVAVLVSTTAFFIIVSECQLFTVEASSKLWFKHLKDQIVQHEHPAVNVNAQKLVEHFLHRQLQSARPVLLVTMGPCAAGKSTTKKPVLDKLGLSETSFLELSIDDVVAQMRAEHPELAKVSYSDMRRKYGAETFLSLLFEIGISRGFNFYYATGEWLERHDAFVHYAYHKGYKTVLAVPVVSVPKHLERLERRNARSDRKVAATEPARQVIRAFKNIAMFLNNPKYDKNISTHDFG